MAFTNPCIRETLASFLWWQPGWWLAQRYRTTLPGRNPAVLVPHHCVWGKLPLSALVAKIYKIKIRISKPYVSIKGEYINIKSLK